MCFYCIWFFLSFHTIVSEIILPKCIQCNAPELETAVGLRMLIRRQQIVSWLSTAWQEILSGSHKCCLITVWPQLDTEIKKDYRDYPKNKPLHGRRQKRVTLNQIESIISLVTSCRQTKGLTFSHASAEHPTFIDFVKPGLGLESWPGNTKLHLSHYPAVDKITTYSIMKWAVKTL